ncbi:CopD family protein [Variovorax dokdonensis]|uniref:CopD family protein n=1 Tax=Variovorax dokdonensis TaxID=344883 RepID=A0ABT7NB14_9BURK|nr:CopD family protein [Variovorax dokdonensis]MDM0045112.1 CopD family protein [Variovorax dokdonensis]
MLLVHLLLLVLHLLAAAFWVGGMATMHFCVRPAAVQLLEPPLRLPLLAGVLARFFRGVTVAIVVLLVTGFAMIMGMGGMAAVGWPVHAMLGIGVVMMLIFGRIRLGLYPRLASAVAARQWPDAGAAMSGIRQLVFVNLLLGVAVFLVVLLARVL